MLDEMEVGQILEVLTDDPAAEEDITRFLKRTGHQLVELTKEDNALRFLIRKNG